MADKAQEILLKKNVHHAISTCAEIAWYCPLDRMHRYKDSIEFTFGMFVRRHARLLNIELYQLHKLARKSRTGHCSDSIEL